MKKTIKTIIKIIFTISFIILLLKIEIINNGPVILGINWFLFALLLLVSYIIAIFLHELGHYFLGRLVGLRLVAIKIGNIVFKKKNNKFTLSIEGKNQYEGYCMMIPGNKQITKKENIVYYLGGILFNIISLLITILIIYFDPSSFNLLFPFALLTITIIFILLIPLPNSDAYYIYGMIKNEQETENILLLNKVIQMLVIGTTPKEISFLREEKKFKDSQMNILWNLYRLYYYRDLEDTKESNKIINEIEKKEIPLHLKTMIFMEFCYENLIIDNKEKAKYYYNQIKSDLEKDTDINAYRLKAYYEHFINKNSKVALLYCDKGKEAHKFFPISGLANLELNLINKLWYNITNLSN